MKLLAWNLTQYDRVLYFDPDVYWTGDATRYFTRYGHARHLAAAVYTGSLVPEWWRAASGGRRYFNSGILFFPPSQLEMLALVARWASGNYTHPRRLSQRAEATEQDLLIAHFDARLTPMDACENFRGYIKGGAGSSQVHCDPRTIIAWHGVRFRSKAPSDWAGAGRAAFAPYPKSLVAWEAGWERRNKVWWVVFLVERFL